LYKEVYHKKLILSTVFLKFFIFFFESDEL